MWDGYKAKYESWSHVKKLREQQAKVEVIMTRMEGKKAELDHLKAKVEELKGRSGYLSGYTSRLRGSELYTQYTQRFCRKKLKFTGEYYSYY